MRVLPVLVISFVPAILSGCTHTVERDLTAPTQAGTLDDRSPYLKAHLPDGRVYVLEQWQADTAGSGIVGSGVLLGVHREELAAGDFRVPADSVALYETNVLQSSGPSSALTVMAGITAFVAGYCVFDPKTCFGSCPTFYAPGPDGSWQLQAEGFSASIAPALEATDIDMLLHTRPVRRDFQLRVTNEALETHVIRRADVVAVPRPPGGRVFVTSDGAFRAAGPPVAPRRCTAANGDCVEAVRTADGNEWMSRADSSDLATKELIELEFDTPAGGELGLVLVSRQTLMTTFLIYQALAYMGRDATRWLSALETGAEAVDRASAVGRLLGSIEVLVQDGRGHWVPAGRSGETGPIAVDTRVVPLGRAKSERIRVRLRLTQGLWRLDAVQVVALGHQVEPLRVRPGAVSRDGVSDTAALGALVDPERTLVTMPGDRYEVSYRLPPDPSSYELFLEARGYYLEWMRREWLAEENPLLAARFLVDPGGTLRSLASAYKATEPEIERLFWGSRYVR